MNSGGLNVHNRTICVRSPSRSIQLLVAPIRRSACPWICFGELTANLRGTEVCAQSHQ